MSDAVLPAPAPPRTRARMPGGVITAVTWLAAILAIALLADRLRPYGITALDLRARLTPPIGFGGGWGHALGTDELGRDVLSRLIESIRISLLIAFGATAIAATFGTTMGFLAAHFRGWAEQVVLMLIDFQASMPFLILALSVLAFFGNSLALFICLMGLYGWERHARIARGLAISANAQGYAAAVRNLGARPLRIYLHHVLPNIASTLIVSATLSFPEVVLLESGLSFLGLGVQPPMTSLGNMVGYGREYLTRAPWILLAPSCVIVLTTLSVSLLGDWLRDRLDPDAHMTDARLERMRRNPAADWAIADVVALCQANGLYCAPPRGGGSHYKVGHARLATKLTIPFKRPIKPVYIRKLAALVEAARNLP